MCGWYSSSTSHMNTLPHESTDWECGYYLQFRTIRRTLATEAESTRVSKMEAWTLASIQEAKLLTLLPLLKMLKWCNIKHSRQILLPEIPYYSQKACRNLAAANTYLRCYQFLWLWKSRRFHAQCCIGPIAQPLPTFLSCLLWASHPVTHPYSLCDRVTTE